MEFGVNLGQSKINDHPSPGLGVVQKVARLDIPMINTVFLQILQANEQLKDVVFDFFQSKGIEESLRGNRSTINGLNLKYSSTICVMSWWTNRFTSFGRLGRFLTSRRKAISA
jgi:hypothetical protein